MNKHVFTLRTRTIGLILNDVEGKVCIRLGHSFIGSLETFPAGSGSDTYIILILPTYVTKKVAVMGIIIYKYLCTWFVPSKNAYV